MAKKEHKDILLVAVDFSPYSEQALSLIHISEPTRLWSGSRLASSA